MKRKKEASIPPSLLVIGLLLFALVGYLCYRWHTSDSGLLPLSVVALIVGVIFESSRLSDKWSTVFYIALGALAISMTGFIPFKQEHGYDINKHIEFWQYLFIACYIVISVVVHEDKIIPKLTEGLTLMQSVALIYWVIDKHIYETAGPFVTVLMVIGLLFSLFTVFNAFTHFALSELTRLILSIWSSIIMVLFAADCILRVLDSGTIEATSSLNDGLYIALSYFLLGVSAIYMAHNLYMLFGLLPGKGRGWSNIADVLERHVKRYSDSQVKVLYSFLCVALTGTAFYLNHHFQLLPRHLAVWIVFIVFPLILTLLDFVEEKTSR